MKKFLIATLLLTSVNLSALALYVPTEGFVYLLDSLNKQNCRIVDIKETRTGLIVYYEYN